MADEAAIPLNPNRRAAEPAKPGRSSPGSAGCATLETTEGPMPLWAVVQKCSPAAATVAIVSISLSIALGIASGAGPQAGLSTAVWGGLTGGLFCSSPYNIIGPAGALAFRNVFTSGRRRLLRVHLKARGCPPYCLGRGGCTSQIPLSSHGIGARPHQSHRFRRV